MDFVVGIDIGHSTAGKATTGLVVIEKNTLNVMIAQPVQTGGVPYALASILNKGDNVSVAVIDGPLAAPTVYPKMRLCEQFFYCGVFSSNMRLMPACTKAGSPFLTAASNVANTLMSQPFNVPNFNFTTPLQPSVIEIFPTIFMASMLPPHSFVGKRVEHTDYLWEKLVNHQNGQPLHVLHPYSQLLIAADSQGSKKAKHEVRAAAICAIAAHAVSIGQPFGFIGTAAEKGFLLPGTMNSIGWMDASFHALLCSAWINRPNKSSTFQWI